MNGDIGESFERFKSSTFINYRGCVITENSSFYIWNDIPYCNLENAKAAIDAAYNTLGSSSNRLNFVPI